MDFSAFKPTDWAIVFATLLGPVLAVQAQRVLEGFREVKNQKLWVFRMLMTTRGSRLAPDHVKALNMIDLAFYGTKVFFFWWRTSSEKNVNTAWKVYRDGLGTDTTNMTPGQLDFFYGQRDNQFAALLSAIARDVGFEFDDVVMRKGGYIPVAHNEVEEQQRKLLAAAVHVMAGEQALKMNVTGFPSDPEAVAQYKALLSALATAAEGGVLNVKIQPPVA